MSLDRTRGRVVSVPSLRNRIRIGLANRMASRAARSAALAGPTLEQRQRDLVVFYQEYESLVETLCDSSQYGPQPGLERKYQALRNWMQENYPSVGSYIVAYLRYEIEDGIDPFRALFAAEDLESFLQMDDGNMISRMMRTREALNRYGDHLRQLASSA
jgi:hypothetical protein